MRHLSIKKNDENGWPAVSSDRLIKHQTVPKTVQESLISCNDKKPSQMSNGDASVWPRSEISKSAKNKSHTTRHFGTGGLPYSQRQHYGPFSEDMQARSSLINRFLKYCIYHASPWTQVWHSSRQSVCLAERSTTGVCVRFQHFRSHAERQTEKETDRPVLDTHSISGRQNNARTMERGRAVCRPADSTHAHYSQITSIARSLPALPRCVGGAVRL